MGLRLMKKIADELEKHPINDDYFDLSVTYIEADDITDIIWAIIKAYGGGNTFFVDCGSLFWDYQSEPVMVFKDFDSSIPLEDMLSILSYFPMFSTRSGEVESCAEKVFVVSDIPLLDQYPDYGRDGELSFWSSFMYCIHNVMICKNNTVKSYSLDDYLEENGIRLED